MAASAVARSDAVFMAINVYRDDLGLFVAFWAAGVGCVRLIMRFVKPTMGVADVAPLLCRKTPTRPPLVLLSCRRGRVDVDRALHENTTDETLIAVNQSKMEGSTGIVFVTIRSGK